MRHLFAASLLACAFALPAAAQDEGPPVPVDKAAYHVPVFRNEYLTLLRVNIPSKRSAGYHIHSKDQISVLIEEADQYGQLLGEQATPPRRTPRGSVTFTGYSKKSMTHRVNNVGPTAFHNIVWPTGRADASPPPRARASAIPSSSTTSGRARGGSCSSLGKPLPPSPRTRRACASSSTAARLPRAFPARAIAA
jgi:hypothetical protein